MFSVSLQSGLLAKEVSRMLKVYGLESLRPGMLLGRDVLDSNANVLVGKGTVLTQDIIFTLMDRPIFSVYIEEEAREDVNIPGAEYLLDSSYVKSYELVCERTYQLFIDLLESETFDEDELRAIVAGEILPKLCDGAKAVSQIHNMSRTGDYLIHHCMHVAILAGLMGKWRKWPEEKQVDFVTAGLLHDVGKQLVPPDILNKHGKLTPEEFRTIQKHPEHGYNMLKLGPLKDKKDILFGILQHHERCDGSGYPNGVKRDEINKFALILALLDIYDAMAADKTYAKRRSPFDVFNILYEDVLKGKLDTEYGVYFIRNLSHSLNGNWVSLSNGDKGRIVYMDESRVTSLPVVQVGDSKFVDLNRESSIKIEAILTADEI